MDEASFSVLLSDIDDAAADVDWVLHGLDSAGAKKIAKNKRYRSMVAERLNSALGSLSRGRELLVTAGPAEGDSPEVAE